MSHTERVRVVFVDALTGRELARTELTSGQLPDSFGSATRLNLGGEPWDVVRADPPTAAEFLASSSLVLTVSRIQVAAPEGWKYSLPTFFDPLPPTEAAIGTGEHFVIHEDDWRRTEMVSLQLAGEVEVELRAIRQIRQQHSRVVDEGESSIRLFDKVHIREAPTAPLTTGVSRRRLFELLPVGGKPYAGLSYDSEQSRVADSFAVDAGPLTLYGQAHGDRVTVLCLAPSPDAPHPGASPELAAGLQQAMLEFDLLLVDWCRAWLVDSSGIGDFLNPA